MRRPSIAILVDADQWPARGLYALLQRANEMGSVGRCFAFGAFGSPHLSVWASHFDLLEVGMDPRAGRDQADQGLIEKAEELARSGAEELWIATKDRRLLARVKERVGEATTVVMAEDPTPAPPGLRVERFALKKMPVPDEARRRLREAVQAATREGYALHSALPEVVDPHLYGRQSIYELLVDLDDEFRVEPAKNGGPVKIYLRAPSM